MRIEDVNGFLDVKNRDTVLCKKKKGVHFPDNRKTVRALKGETELSLFLGIRGEGMFSDPNCRLGIRKNIFTSPEMAETREDVVLTTSEGRPWSCGFSSMVNEAISKLLYKLTSVIQDMNLRTYT